MKIRTILMSMLAMTALASCNKENDPTTSPKADVQEGVATVARFTLSQSGATRAGTEGATADESAIKTATIYVFKSDGILEKAVVFTSTDITTGSKVFPITSGAKSIYAAINIPTAQLTGIVENSTSRTAFEQKILTIDAIADATTPIATGDGWWMANTTGAVSSTLTALVSESDAAAGVNNNVTIPVGRTTAKVTVAVPSSATIIDGSSFTLSGYKVVNNAKKSFLMPNITLSGTYTSPNHYEGAVTPADYFNQTAFSNTAIYATENTHATPLFGNTSTVVIKARFSPMLLLDKDGVGSSLPSSGTFFRIQKSDYTFTANYYSEAPTAAEIAAKTGNDAGAAPVEYTGGVCYYRLLIADNSQVAVDRKYAVIRNNYYKISIVNVNGAGSNTEEGIEPGQPGQPDPDQPVEQTTNMKATISILPWNVIEQNGGI